MGITCYLLTLFADACSLETISVNMGKFPSVFSNEQLSLMTCILIWTESTETRSHGCQQHYDAITVTQHKSDASANVALYFISLQIKYKVTAQHFQLLSSLHNCRIQVKQTNSKTIPIWDVKQLLKTLLYHHVATSAFPSNDCSSCHMEHN